MKTLKSTIITVLYLGALSGSVILAREMDSLWWILLPLALMFAPPVYWGCTMTTEEIRKQEACRRAVLRHQYRKDK